MADSPSIYFLHDGECIKIGYSANPRSRVSSLQTACSRLVRLLGTISGSEEDEKRLHERFAHLRVRGEWFRAHSELTEFIKSRCGYAHVPQMKCAKDLDWCHVCGERNNRNAELWWPDNAEHEKIVFQREAVAAGRYLRICEKCIGRLGDIIS